MLSLPRAILTAFVMFLTGLVPARGDLLISQFLANPSSTDSPKEYVELVATQAIDFSATPYSVVFSKNGTAAVDGWVAGGSKTYGFSINSGTVVRGDVVYVGGSLAQPLVGGGTSLRAINTGTTGGDVFGNSSSSGVLGNGGTSADGIAVFSVVTGSLTSSTVPVDAIFFGDSIGSAFVSASEGYTLPNNDRYFGGRLQTDSFLFADGNSAEIGILSGTFQVASGSWLTARSVTYTTMAPTIGTTSLSLDTSSVPEPGTLILALLGAVPLAAYLLVKGRSMAIR